MTMAVMVTVNDRHHHPTHHCCQQGRHEEEEEEEKEKMLLESIDIPHRGFPAARRRGMVLILRMRGVTVVL